MTTLESIDAEIAEVKARRRDLRWLAVALPNTSIRRANFESELDSIHSRLGGLYARRRATAHDLATQHAAGNTAPAPVAPRPVPQMRVVAQFFPAQPSHVLPLPTAWRESRDSDIVGYETVWTPHRNAASLIGDRRTRERA